MKTMICAAGAMLLTAVHAAGQPLEFDAALAALEGRWEGRLDYRDFTSGELASVPHTREVVLSPDGSYALQIMTFADPGSLIYDAELVLAGEDGVLATSVRGGLQPVRLELDALEETMSGWRATLSGDTIDEGVPARARYTWTYEGDRFEQLKEVRTAPEAPWRFRNAVRLTRAGTAAD